MTSQKVYRPTLFVSSLSYFVLVAFFAVFLLVIYGFVISIIDEIQRAQQLSLSFQETGITILILIIVVSIVLCTLLFVMIIAITGNLVSIYVCDHGFQVSSLFYKSKWLTWDKITKIRSFSLHENGRIIQIGVDGLAWIFKLNGLLYWMYPYGAINFGEKSLQNGSEFIKILKQQRPDLFK